MGKLKVIFDTDPGVDDAMALLLLARHPDVEVVAVTTTFGNGTIETTTRNAVHLVQRFGLDCPVGCGTAGRLVSGEVSEPPTFVHGDNGLGNIPLPEVTVPADLPAAAQLIVDLVRASPGEITIIAVGRMTNLALALRRDPAIAALVKQVVVMGGAFGRNGHSGNVNPVAEANIFGDPVAADIAFGAEWPMTIVPLDVTHETIMTTDFVRGMAAGGGADGQFLWDVSRFYENFYVSTGTTRGGFAVHDSSAVGYALHPEFFTLERGPVRVVAEGIAKGQTILRPEKKFDRATDFDGRPSVNVCTGVDSAAFLDFYRATITGRH